MGLFSKIFGSRDDSSHGDEVIGIDVETKRRELSDLSAALSELTMHMRDDEFPTDNPGWMGRVQDLAQARMDADTLSSQPEFDRQDVFDFATTVRPLYRGDAPEEFRGLEELNDRVVRALDALLS